MVGKKFLVVILLATLGISPAQAHADVLKVLVSGGLRPVLEELNSRYEESSGDQIELVAAPSMGETAGSIPKRLARHENADVLVMVDDGIAPLAEHGWVDSNKRLPLANSQIALAVNKNAPSPDITNAAKLKQVLLASHRVAYSDSASGLYVSGKLFRILGIEKEMSGKAFKVPATPVGELVANGKAEVGLQQLSELKAVPGIKVVGLIPHSVQKTTLYSAIPVNGSKHTVALERYLEFLRSARVSELINDKGMTPVAYPTDN